MAYVDDLSELGETPHAEIMGWLNRNKKTAPKGTEKFDMVRGITARKFVEVQVNVFTDIERYRDEFFKWLKTIKGFNPEWISREWYSFRSVGKRTKPT